jgi:hypothetical protein
MMRGGLIVLATVCVFGVLGPAFGSVMFGIWVAVATLDPKTAAAGLLLLVPPFAIFPYWFGAPGACDRPCPCAGFAARPLQAPASGAGHTHRRGHDAPLAAERDTGHRPSV